MPITETPLTETPITLESTWVPVGAVLDVSGATEALFFVTLTANDARSVEARMCAYRATGEAYEYVPQQKEPMFRACKKAVDSFAFDLQPLGPLPRLQMQMRHLGLKTEEGEKPTVDTAYLTHE